MATVQETVLCDSGKYVKNIQYLVTFHTFVKHHLYNETPGEHFM